MNPFPPPQNSFFVPIISKGFRNEKLQLESISSPTAIKLCIVFFCCKNATFSLLGEFFLFQGFYRSLLNNDGDGNENVI